MRKKETKAEMPQALTDEALKEAPENGKRQERMEENEKPLLRNRSYLLLLQGNLFSGFGDVSSTESVKSFDASATSSRLKIFPS